MPGADVVIQQWGAFGAVFLLILGPLAAFAMRQTLKLNEVQALRVQDAKEVRDTLLTATRDFSEALQEQVRLATETEGASEHMIETMERMDGRLHEIENLFRGHEPPQPRRGRQ